MASSDAYQQFLASTVIDYEKWHDGEGYDLGALQRMTGTERHRAEGLMLERDIGWREIEVLEALGTARSWKAIARVFTHDRSIDTQLAAAAALDRSGKLGRPIDDIVAEAVLKLRTVEGGSTRALLLAEQHPTERVKQALLRASGRKSEIAMHCAALLCFLCGKAKEAFDWELRPLFLRLSPDNETLDRKAAYRELCVLVEMTTGTPRNSP